MEGGGLKKSEDPSPSDPADSGDLSSLPKAGKDLNSAGQKASKSICLQKGV